MYRSIAKTTKTVTTILNYLYIFRIKRDAFPLQKYCMIFIQTYDAPSISDAEGFSF